MNMTAKNVIYAHVHTNWNLVLLLLFLRNLKFDTLVLIAENKVSLLEKLLVSKLPFSIKIYDASASYKKVLTILTFRYLNRKDSCVRFIKFTNYSFYGQCIQKMLDSKNVTFIDEGTTFINLAQPELKYTSPVRMFFKRLFWPSPYTPDFNCFSGVNEAFIMYHELVSDQIDESVLCQDIDSFFNPESLKALTSEWLDIAQDLERWRNYFNDDDCSLIIGSPYVSHNLMEVSKYLELLNVAREHLKNRIFYKKHPTEITKSYFGQVDFQLMAEIDIPAELLFAYSIPFKVVSFGSTSGFMLRYYDHDSSVIYVLPTELFDIELIHSIDKISDQILIIGV